MAVNVLDSLVNDRPEEHLGGEARCEAVLVEELVLARAASIDVDVSSEGEYLLLLLRGDILAGHQVRDRIPIDDASLWNPSQHRLEEPMRGTIRVRDQQVLGS